MYVAVIPSLKFLAYFLPNYTVSQEMLCLQEHLFHKLIMLFEKAADTQGTESYHSTKWEGPASFWKTTLPFHKVILGSVHVETATTSL